MINHILLVAESANTNLVDIQRDLEGIYDQENASGYYHRKREQKRMNVVDIQRTWRRKSQ